MKKRLSLLIVCALLLAAILPAQAFAAEPVKIEVTGVPADLYVGADVATKQTITLTVKGQPFPIDYVAMRPVLASSYDVAGWQEGGKITKAGDYVINIGIERSPRLKYTGVSSVTVNGIPAVEFGSFAKVIDSFREDGETWYSLDVKLADYTAREVKSLRDNGKIYVDTYLPYDGTLYIKCFIKVTETKPVDTGLPFTDVAASDWFCNFLKPAYESGIVGGATASTYSPKGQLTHGQIMVMIANLHSKQKGDGFKGSSVAGDHWAASFRDYCKAEGIIDGRFDEVLDKPVTRAEMAYYFANTLTAESYQNKKDVSLNDIAEESCKAEIEKLVAADIVGGYSDGTFKPENLVTRAEAAVFVSNILNAMAE
ncbi:MAG: S-layer homology domain-containing protein [Firmicutes bacterium]|nr:S-layer homology domain-containing protein [Bacillota bacterium]